MTDLLNGNQDETIGAEGEIEEPLDLDVRNLATLAYLVTTCEALGIIDDADEWDAFMYARALHRRVRATLAGDGAS